MTPRHAVAFLSWPPLAIEAAQAQDATAGKAVFAQCAACHSIDGNGVDPSLQGVFGHQVGLRRLRYSRAMKSTAYNWDAAHLDAYLANPQTAIPAM